MLNIGNKSNYNTVLRIIIWIFSDFQLLNENVKSLIIIKKTFKYDYLFC